MSVVMFDVCTPNLEFVDATLARIPSNSVELKKFEEETVSDIDKS